MGHNGVLHLHGPEYDQQITLGNGLSSDTWQKGAQQLDSDTLRNLANDPRNLQAVDGPTNSAKGDGDAATWLPPNHQYRCTYVARQVQIKAEYRLWVTDAERDAIAGILTSCGGTSTPTAATTTLAPEPARPGPKNLRSNKPWFPPRHPRRSTPPNLHLCPLRRPRP